MYRPGSQHLPSATLTARAQAFVRQTREYTVDLRDRARVERAGGDMVSRDEVYEVMRRFSELQVVAADLCSTMLSKHDQLWAGDRA